MMSRAARSLSCAVALMLPAPAFAAASSPIVVAGLRRETPVDFAREILPLLRQNCLACHNQTKARGGLNLENPAAMLKGGDTGPAIVVSDGAGSLLVRAAAHEAEDLAMPPAGNQANAVNLTGEEVGLLKLWVDQGARGGAPAEAPVVWQPLPDAWRPILAVSVSADGQVAAAGRGSQVDIIHLASATAWDALRDPGLPRRAAHRDAVQSVAFSPDGTWLATGGFREAKLWRLWRPDLLPWPDAGRPGAVADAAAFSPDGLTAAVVGGDSVEVRHADSGQFIKGLPAGSAAPRHLRVSPDGARLAAITLRGRLLVWSLADGTLEVDADPGFRATGVAWLADSATLAAGAAGSTTLNLLRPAGSGLEPAGRRELHTNTVHAVAQSITGRLATGDEGGRVVIWDDTAARPSQVLEAGAPVIGLRWLGDFRVAADTAAGPVIWRLDAEPAVRVELHGSAWADQARWSATNSLRRASAEMAWQAAAQKRSAEEIPKATETLAKARERFAATEKEAREKTAARTQKAQARADAEKAAALPEAPAAAKELLNTARDEEGKADDEAVRAVAQRDAATRDVDLALQQLDRMKAEEKEALQRGAEAMQAVSVAEAAVTAADSSAAAGGLRIVAALPAGQGFLARDELGRFSLWTEGGVALPPAWLGFRGEVLDVSATAVLLRDERGRVSRLPLARPEWRLARRLGRGEDARLFSDRVLAVAFSPDGRRLATGGGEPSRSGGVALWEVETGRLIARAPNLHSDTVTALAFSPDGRQLASGGADRFARLADADSLEPLRNLEGHTGHVLALAWREDGRVLATGGADLTVKLWDAASGERGKQATGFTREVTGLAFLPATGHWAAASGDSELRVFNEQGEPVRALSLPGDFTHALAASGEGAWLVAGGASGVLRGWSGGEDQPRFELPPPAAIASSP